MDPGGGGGGGVRAEAERLLGIAEQLLAARDLIGSKKFAEQALDSDPLLDGVDQILAVADVLLASQRRINNHLDWYSILTLDPSSDGRDPSALTRQYRRLALLLRPDHNHSPGADAAFRLVSDAWAVLSDPSKKALFDSELEIAAAHQKSNGPDHSDPPTFWTSCSYCCHVYQYDRAYLNRTLLCQTCRRGFHATEIAAAPPIVPGTDMYYCSWGFVPLGFHAPGGPEFGSSGWKPFYPMNPAWDNQPSSQPSGGRDGSTMNAADGNVVEPQRSAAAKNMKSVAKKKVGRPPKKRVPGVEAEKKSGMVPEAWEGIEVTPGGVSTAEEVERSEGGGVVGEDVGMNRFDLELDAADVLLGNLPNLPFLKDEEMQTQ